MAQEAVNAVVQAFQRGMEQVQARNARQEELKLQQQREKAAEAAEQKRQDLAERQFEAAQKAADASHQLQMQIFEANKAHQEYNDLQTFQQTNIPPPGSTVQKNPQFDLSNVGPAGIPVPIPTSAATSVNFPGTAPTGMQVNPGAGGIPAITPTGGSPDRTYNVPSLAESPSVQLAFQQEQLRNQNDLMRQLQVAAVNHANALDLQKAQALSASKLEDQRGGWQLKVANARATGNTFGDIADIPGLQDTISQGAMGAMSQEDLRKKFTPKQVAQLNQFAGESHFQFFPQKTVDAIKGVETGADLVPHIRNMLNIWNANPTTVNIPGTKAYADFKAEQQLVRERATQQAPALSTVRRLSTPELQRFDEYFIPGTIPKINDPNASLIKLNGFEEELKQGLARALKGVTPEQRESVINNLTTKGVNFNSLLTFTPKTGGIKAPSGAATLSGPEPIILPNPQKPGAIIYHKYNPKTNTFDVVPNQGQ